jgi:hypothetical protein
MRQGALLAAVSLLLWSAGPPAAALPSSLDGGIADAGRDAGADGGLDAGPLARWTLFEPGQVADAGATDLVELSVGAWVEVPLDKPVVLTVCDAPLAAVEERPKGLRFTGLDAGATHCGLWFFSNAFPQRYVEVRVVR